MLAALGVVASVAARRFRRISHHELKQRVVRAAACLPERAIAHFAKGLVVRCERRLARLKREHGRARISVLATAAPDLYATTLARALGFDHVVASGYRSSIYVETRCEQKRDAVVELSIQLGVDVEALFTDHLDDLALAERAARVVLVDAGAKTIAAFRSHGIEFVATNP